MQQTIQNQFVTQTTKFILFKDKKKTLTPPPIQGTNNIDPPPIRVHFNIAYVNITSTGWGSSVKLTSFCD